MSDVVVTVRGATRTYNEETVPVHALRGVDMDVHRGDFVSLAGPSGSGKSTLLNLNLNLDLNLDLDLDRKSTRLNSSH